jgi:hypothetical protein
MLKSTAVFLGLLFGLATAYYLSYWGFFSINAFPYLAVEDIIKGVAYPLRYGGVWLLGAVAFVLLVFIADSLTGPLPKRGKRLLAIFLAFAVIAAVTYVQFADNNIMGMVFSILLSMPLMMLYFIVDMEHERTSARNSNAEHPLTTASNAMLVYAGIFLSINAIVAGQVEARAIHSGRRFSYMLSKDLPADKITTKKPYLIFLGAVGEKYIFIDSKEDERFILDKDELPALRLHNYDEADSATKQQFKRYLTQVPTKPTPVASKLTASPKK